MRRRCVVITLLCALMTAGGAVGGVASPPTAHADEAETEIVLEDFEADPPAWNTAHASGSISASFEVSDAQASEGARSGLFTYAVSNVDGTDWVRILRSFPGGVDVSEATELRFDVFPNQDIQENRDGTAPTSEPLILRVYDTGGRILAEGNLRRLVPGEWNTVVYNASTWDDIGSIQLWSTPLNRQFGPDHPEVSFHVDNIRVAVPQEPGPIRVDGLLEGFEGDVSRWVATSAPAITTSFSASTDRASEGSRSAKIQFDVSNFDARSWVEVRRSFSQEIDISDEVRLTMDIFPTSETRSHATEPLVVQLWGDGGTRMVDVTLGKLEPNEWNTVSFPLTRRSTLEQIKFLTIPVFSSYEGREQVTYYIDDIQLIPSPGDLEMDTWLSPTLAFEDVSEFNDHRVGFDFNDIWHNPSNIEPELHGSGPIIDAIDHIVENMYPVDTFEFSLGGVPSIERRPPLDSGWILARQEIVQHADDRDIPIWMEGHNLPNTVENLTERGLVPIDGMGRTPSEVPGYDQAHAYDMTNPEVIELVQSKAELAVRDLGTAGYSMVDYVWPSAGGWGWGYSESAREQWKRVLSETDKGIPIHTPEGVATMHFWQYFEDYNGFRLSPSDLGISSWSEYEPVTQDQLGSDENKRNFYVLNMLYHYQWLFLASEVGETAQEHGGEVMGIFNPEFSQNGTDLSYWARAANTGMGIFEEWGSADVIVNNYSNAGYFVNEYAAVDKPMALIGEAAAAGGNPWLDPPRPHYWDNRANYLINYTLQGIWNWDSHEEEYWGGQYEDMIDEEQPWYSSFTGMKASLDGTLLAANDEVTRPAADVLSITLRSLTGHENVAFDRGGDGQSYNLAKSLTMENYLYDQAAFPLDNVDLDAYDTLLYSPRETPQGYFTDLRAWLDEPGRTLITHSFVPRREIDGVSVYDSDKTALQGGVEGDVALGLGAITTSEITSGMVTGIDPEFAEHLALEVGDPLQLRGPLHVIPNGRPLVTLGDLNLVTEVEVGDSRVIYLNFAPDEGAVGGSSVELAVMDAVMSYLGKESYAQDDRHQFGTMKFEKPGGLVFSIISRQAIEDARADAWPFMALDDRVTGSVDVVVEPSSTYRVVDVLTKEVEQLTSDADGLLEIDMDGHGLRVVQLYRDSIGGKVIDSDREPIVGAVVEVVGESGVLTAVSDVNGNYTVEGLTSGEQYEVSATTDGLETVGGPISVTFDGYFQTLHIEVGPRVPEPVPAITTSVVVAGSEAKVLPLTGGTVLDTVRYEGLTPGREYVVEGSIRTVPAGEGTGLAALVRFTPATAGGSVEVAFEITSAQAAQHTGRSLVVFESLSLDGELVAEQADATGAAQTFTVAQRAGEPTTGEPTTGEPTGEPSSVGLAPEDPSSAEPARPGGAGAPGPSDGLGQTGVQAGIAATAAVMLVLCGAVLAVRRRRQLG